MLVSYLPIQANVFISDSYAVSADKKESEEVEKGPNKGRMLRDGNFAIELAIFETGVPPEFHIYATQDGKTISANDIKVNVQLTRLGNVIDDINFTSEGDFACGDMVIYEPHSFVVTLTATYKGQQHRWSYDNFEGRVQVNNDVANEMGVSIERVGPKMLQNIVEVYGVLKPAPHAVRNISARFAGEVQKLNVTLGDRVKKGQKLMTIISNDSLQPYALYSPISGVVTLQETSTGAQTSNVPLLTITDTSKLIAEVNVFPKNQAFVKPGQEITLTTVQSGLQYKATINSSLYQLTPEQAKVFRVEVDNKNGQFNAGQFISARIITDSYQVPLAVKKTALQRFRDFTVVYTKVGSEYEVRMLELGRESTPWVEVLGGIKAGSEYVVDNSYLIKADIDKSAASHDH